MYVVSDCKIGLQINYNQTEIVGWLVAIYLITNAAGIYINNKTSPVEMIF